MKVMLPEALAESEQRSVLKHEAKLAERFEHTNIVRFYKLVLNKKRGYILMDYFRAPNLKVQIQTEIVSLHARFARLVEQLCSVLGYLHGQGYVHRDIKPDNILFNKASELRLIDFSLTTKAAGAVAKMIGAKERSIQGTRTYIPPEAILKKPITPQSDIYSLGITLFEVLAGEPPFRGSSPDDLLKKHLIGQVPEPSAFNPNVTSEMDRMILKMLQKNASKRHHDTHEVLAEFRNLKPFKEDPIEVDKRKKLAEAERYKTTLDKAGRLDSRADHERQQFLRANAELENKAPAKPTITTSTSKPTPAKSPAAAPAKSTAAPAPAKSTVAPAPAKGAAAPAAATAKPAAAAPARPQQAPAPQQQPARPQQPAQAGQQPPMPAHPMHQQPMHPGYAPNPYGHPGYAQHPYPAQGYPPGYPQQPGYPQPGYP
jgi:serine/threonine-protein kinase